MVVGWEVEVWRLNVESAASWGEGAFGGGEKWALEGGKGCFAFRRVEEWVVWPLNEIVKVQRHSKESLWTWARPKQVGRAFQHLNSLFPVVLPFHPAVWEWFLDLLDQWLQFAAPKLFLR